MDYDCDKEFNRFSPTTTLITNRSTIETCLRFWGVSDGADVLMPGDFRLGGLQCYTSGLLSSRTMSVEKKHTRSSSTCLVTIVNARIASPSTPRPLKSPESTYVRSWISSVAGQISTGTISMSFCHKASNRSSRVASIARHIVEKRTSVLRSHWSWRWISWNFKRRLFFQ